MRNSSPPRSAPRRSAPGTFSVRPSQLTGTVLGERYKVHGYLRSGASARVLLAEDLETLGTVAIKLLSPAAANDAARRARLEQAGEELAPTSHANLVDLLGVDETEAGVPYLVMEALSGETLDETLYRFGALPLDLSLVVLRQACAGLIALHESGLVHGHVAPENLILLGAPAEPYGVKVLNYGIARLFRGEPASGFDAARFAYLAPEQVLDQSDTVESDVYALGVLLCHCLSGKLPFAATDEDACLRQKLGKQRLTSLRLDSAQDARLETLIDNATREHPRNRYRSVRALLDVLDVVVGISSGEVRSLPLTQSPDVYEPRTERGRARLGALTPP